MVSEFIQELIVSKTSEDEKNKYAMLGRMRSDCEYYLNDFVRNEKHLWSLKVEDHIEDMKALYNSFPDDKKPEWLSMEDIEKFEKEMLAKKIKIIGG